MEYLQRCRIESDKILIDNFWEHQCPFLLQGIFLSSFILVFILLLV
jgi:hypothetical protein